MYTENAPGDEQTAMRAWLRTISGRRLFALYTGRDTPAAATPLIWEEICRRRRKRYAGQPARLAARLAETPANRDSQAHPGHFQRRAQERAARLLGVEPPPPPRPQLQHPPVVCQPFVVVKTARGAASLAAGAARKLYEDLSVSCAVLRRLRRPSFLAQGRKHYASANPAVLEILGLGEP